MVREHGDMQDLVPAAGAVVTARMPTAAERGEFDIAEGVVVFQVVSAGRAEVFPADRWRLRWPG